MIARYVFDTGALIGAERGDARAMSYVGLVALGRAEIVTPTVCVVEWWRGRTDRRDRLLRSVIVEALPLAAAKAAGVALAKTKQRTESKLSIDAAVIAFAALIGAPVVTSDRHDLERFGEIFPGVRLLPV